MLRRALALLLMFAMGRAHAQGDDPHDALRRPERLTVALNDQFLGQLAPDQRTLFFVSNQDTRKEIYAQDKDDARARRVFDEAADVTWPRVSPDGKALLYISFSDRATGRLCVRSLPEGEDRRCLDQTAAALQAEWIDRRHIALVARTSIDGNLRMSEVTVGDDLTARTMFDQNWTNPAVSPDGRWLAYVPLDRTATRVGPGFAARTAGRLALRRLDHKSPSVELAIDLPGMTGQPAFSADGSFLYFVQFFSDSNRDGLIDAGDHGVLFRLPFHGEAADAATRVASEAPLQLTDSGWNCQYPAPGKQTLITTCSRGRDLDVYELPLDGQVPSAWTRERLRTELTLGGKREEQLLLYRQALGRATELSWRRLITMRLVMAHLDVEEFDAAEFYANKVKALREPETRGIGRPLLALVAQRRARSARERGRLLDTFADEAHARSDELVDKEKDSPAARILHRVVRSEIADSLGDKGAARRELESVVLDGDIPRAVLEAYYGRADALYRQLDDREALAHVSRQLASRDSLKPEVQLDFARATVRALTRGLPIKEAQQVLVHERAKAPPESELAFALQLAGETLTIEPGKPDPDVKARMIALYESQTRADRKRAIVLDAVQRASDLGADWAIETLSERYLDDVPKGTQERRRAERLYKRAIMGRAFRRLAKGKTDEAQLDFDEVFKRTEALEALVSSIDLRVRAGVPSATIEQQLLPSTHGASPLVGFLHAFLLANELPTRTGEAHARAVEEARAALRGSWNALKSKAPARALAAAIMHEKCLHDGDLAAAETANAQYTVALELAQYDPRYQASILGQLGLLHTHVGNYRIALDYFEQRERLPLGDDQEALAVRLAAARARLHVGDDDRSKTSSEDALSLVDRVPALASYRVLALDRAALDNLAAGRFERALALYDREVPLLSNDARPESRRNRFVVRLARAAAAIGSGQPQRALDDLVNLEPGLKDDTLITILTPPHVTEKQVARSYQTIASGLQANAQLALGRLAEASQALERQHAVFALRLEDSEREEDARALALVETRLAAVASARGDSSGAATWIKRAIEHADQLARRLDVKLDGDQLHVLRVGAELHALHGVPVELELARRVASKPPRPVGMPSQAYRSYQHWLEIYEALTTAPAPSVVTR